MLGWFWCGPHLFTVSRHFPGRDFLLPTLPSPCSSLPSPCSSLSLFSFASSLPVFVCHSKHLKENLFPPLFCFPFISAWYKTRTIGNSILESYQKNEQHWRRKCNSLKWVFGILLQFESNILKKIKDRKKGRQGRGRICKGSKKGRGFRCISDLDSRISHWNLNFIMYSFWVLAYRVQLWWFAAFSISLTTYLMHLHCLVSLEKGFLVLDVIVYLHKALSLQWNSNIFWVTISDMKWSGRSRSLQWKTVWHKNCFIMTITPVMMVS